MENNLPQNTFQPNNAMPPITPSNELMPGRSKMRINQSTIFIAVAVLAVLFTGALLLTNSSYGSKLSFLKFGFASNRAVAQKAVDFLNANSGTYLQGATATLGTVSNESGVVKFQANIGGKDYDSYTTKDGKLLFPSAIELDENK